MIFFRIRMKEAIPKLKALEDQEVKYKGIILRKKLQLLKIQVK